MDGEAAKKNLHEAAKTGDVARFTQLVEQDPYLVDEVSFAYSRNLLHIATMHGQARIVEEVLKMSPQLARELDSQNSLPLHIAAAKGYVEIVAMLLRIAPEMCWWRDGQGMNPVHVAAMNGHVDVLKELLRLDSSPAMERLQRGQTVLHLCAKHHRIRALKALAKKLGELVEATDDDGETILHLAARCNDVEIIRYLVESNKIDKETQNSMGKTALQILMDSPTTTTPYSELKRLLNLFSLPYASVLRRAIPKLTDTAMVVVILIATMAFQATVSPPGGVWQEDTSSHRAGEAVMASTHPKTYKYFVWYNTAAFVSSLLTIFLITTGEPSQNSYCQVMALCAAWSALASIAVSYGASIVVLTPNAQTKPLRSMISVVVLLSLIFFSLPLFSIYLRHRSWKGASSQERVDSEL